MALTLKVIRILKGNPFSEMECQILKNEGNKIKTKYVGIPFITSLYKIGDIFKL